MTALFMNPHAWFTLLSYVKWESDDWFAQQATIIVKCQALYEKMKVSRHRMTGLETCS